MNNSIRNAPKPTTLLTDGYALIILSLGLLVRLIAASIVPPGFDEAYYGLYAQHLAWGYFDHPPAVAISAGIGYWITGIHDALSLRFGAIILFLFTTAFLYQLTLSLYNQTAARLTIALLHITPFFLVGMGAFVIPDNVLGVCWAGFLFFVHKVRQTRSARWFVPAGICLGVGLLAKYHAILLLGTLGLILLLANSWQRYLKQLWTYLGLGVALLIFLPNIWWNYQHEWISYLFQIGKSTDGLSISPILFFQGILVQMGYLFPWNMVVLIGGTAWAFKESRHQSGWLLPFVLIPIIAFTLIGATRQILPHWPMPGYLGALALAGGWMSTWRLKKAWNFVVISGIATVVILVIVVMQSATGFLPIDKKADVSLDGQGWQEVVIYLDEEGYLGREDLFLFTNKWYTGGELAFAVGGKALVTVLNEKSPHAFAFWNDTQELLGQDGLFISTDRYPFQPVDLYEDVFTDYEIVGSISTYRRGREAQIFSIWLCRDLQQAFPNPYLKYPLKRLR
ncbi:glycosyltransferase family 39 protein [bacterium]|nr:glycosyltransferase family 39 protein [bacterium]